MWSTTHASKTTTTGSSVRRTCPPLWSCASIVLQSNANNVHEARLPEESKLLINKSASGDSAQARSTSPLKAKTQVCQAIITHKMCSTWRLVNAWHGIQNLYVYLLCKLRWESRRASATQPTPVTSLPYTGVVAQDTVPPMDLLASSGKMHLHLLEFMLYLHTL